MTLTGRIAIFLVVSALATATVVIGVSHVIEQRRIRDENLHRYRVLVENTVNSMIQAMTHEPPESIDQVLGWMKSDAVKEVRVIDASGTVIHSSALEEVGQRSRHITPEWFARPTTLFESHRDGDQVHVVVARPVGTDNRCVECHTDQPMRAAIEMELNSSDVLAEVAEERRLITIGILLALAFSFGLVLFALRRYLLTPTRQLVDAMKRVKRGELDTRVEIEAPREFNELAEHFNEMVKRLERAQDTVEQQHSDGMERTERLATTGQLAATMAHEIQNPLAGLSGALQVMRKDAAMADRQEIVDEMLSTIDRLAETVRTLLVFARPPSPEPQQCDVNKALRGALLLIKQQRRVAEQVTFEEALDAELPITVTDPSQLQQVFLNVGLNAVQAMTDGGTLTVRSSHAGLADSGKIKISFEDTGQGITPEVLQSVGKPFFTTKSRGTGLGIAISRRIVERHGGTLEIESEVGKGTKIHIEVPVDTDLGAARAREGA